MKKYNRYKYVGINGSVTTPIILENIDKTLIYKLVAEDNKMLTNGNVICKSINVYPEDLEYWKEIDA